MIVKLSWLKKLLLAAYVFGVIAISIQLTAKSAEQGASHSDKKHLIQKQDPQQSQSSIQFAGYKQ